LENDLVCRKQKKHVFSVCPREIVRKPVLLLFFGFIEWLNCKKNIDIRTKARKKDVPKIRTGIFTQKYRHRQNRIKKSRVLQQQTVNLKKNSHKRIKQKHETTKNQNTRK